MPVTVSQGSDDNNSSSAANTIHFDFDTMRAYFSAVLSQLRSRVTLDTVRPLPMFMGVSGQNFCFSPEAFTPPVKKMDKSTLEKFKSRLRLNFAFFLSNYALVAAGVALVIALMHPGMLISVTILWGLWAFHNFLISNEFIVFGHNIGTLVSITHRSATLTVFTILVVVWKCLVPTIMAVAVSGLLILSHAIMRDPKHIDTLNNSGKDTPNNFGKESSNNFGGKDSDDEGTSDSEVMVERPLVRKDLA